MPPASPPGGDASLQFPMEIFETAWFIDWLTPIAERRGRTFRIHHHDNLAAEIVSFEPYERRTFRRCLHWFRTRPAAEGGSNLAGVIGPSRAWLLVLKNDNQGGLRAEFLGPAEMCAILRSHLDSRG